MAAAAPARVIFPDWARLVGGLVIAFVSFLLADPGIDSLRISEDLRGVISSIILLLATAGIVPPKPGTVKIGQNLGLILTLVAIALGYVLNAVVDIEPVLRACIIATIALLGSLGIIPPQARRL